MLALLLGALFLCSALPTTAQLPGKKPESFEPVVPDFSAPSADWWTGWPDASTEEKKQWLDTLDEAWRDWRVTLPDNEDLQERADEVERSLKGIRVTWDKFGEYQKVAVLPEVEFPRNPSVLAWAESDAAVARGRQRLVSLQLEVRQVDDTLGQSLSRLRQRVVVLREAGSEGLDRQLAALSLLAAQLNQINIIEQRSALEEQMRVWQEQIDLGEAQLARMLNEIRYSAEAGEKLQESLNGKSDKIEQLTAKRAELRSSTLQSAEPDVNMQRDLQLMELETRLLENYLQKRKDELLQSINRVLNPELPDHQLVMDRDLLETARNLIDSTSRELNIRQRQVVAWTDDESEDMSRWWRYFERIDSALGRAADLIDDVVRYEAAQLKVYRERQGWWATVRERSGHFFNMAYTRWRGLADHELFTIAESPITLRGIARIIFVLVIAWLISGLVRRFLNRLVRKKHASEQSMYNLGRVLHYSIIGIALMVALVMLGLDASKLALVAGALSVGIGFGMQAIFSNFISGLILLFEQPLRVGDLVELESGVFGRIRDINVRSTRVTTRDNIDILVPNTEFVAGRVINHTLDDPVRRIHVSFNVAYGSDPDLVREAATEAAEQVNITHTDWKRKTEVWLMEFGDYALKFKLVVWVNSNMVSPLDDPYALYNLELLREFNDRGIEIPFPQRDLHLRSWDVPVKMARRSGD
ncbi:mechanosensitive ion channel family protein [Microbulbifer litoralis]|uniref:mechanosensitive ion channel family protein n=1 Tax=Microbulbifer litoralis TaxID=2933965 RepID=UPI0020280464|nr:mechanosensitive ion channel domain-containing protein [Microbulbifer sp. GX H0434]